jgi:hypothetical protein
MNVKLVYLLLILLYILVISASIWPLYGIWTLLSR